MLDVQTEKLMTDGERLSAMVKSEGWAVARKRLTDLILDMGSVLGLQERDPMKMSVEIASRQMTVEALINWLKEVEGTVAQHEANKDIYRRLQEEGTVLRQ